MAEEPVDGRLSSSLRSGRGEHASCGIGSAGGVNPRRIGDRPAREGLNRIQEVAAEIGQGIFHLRRRNRSDSPNDEAILLQPAQGGGQHLLADLADLALQRVEAARTVPKGSDDQKRPFVADPGQHATNLFAGGSYLVVTWFRQRAFLPGHCILMQQLRDETSIQEDTLLPKPRIALIIGSTRAARVADKPAQWMLKQVQARDDLEVELVDLRNYPLPFFDEVASNARVPSQNPEVIRWQETVGRFDGYIFVVAEYNHSIPGVFKNALDQAYNEWNKKPFSVIGYGSAGAARAVEHLRSIGVELQMVSTHAAVHIGGPNFMAIHPMFGNKPIEEIEGHLLASAKTALDELVWWTRAITAAKAVESRSF